MVRGWATWSGARLLLMISATCAVLAIAVMAAVIKVDHDGTLREAETRNAVLAQILEEHARRSFDISKAALLDLGDQVLVDGKLTVTAPLAARMKRWIHDIPGISSFWLIDDQGRAVYVTIPHSTEGFNFADRAYFKAHAAGEEFYVSPMTLGKIDRKWFFSLSRRIVDDKGRFRGLLIASIQTEFFASTWSKLGLAPADNIGIYKTDGMTVVRRLANWDGDVAPSNAKSALFTLFPQKPVGIYESTSPIDGIRRIIAYRPVEGWQLVVASGSELQGVLAPWYRRTIRNSLFCGVVLLALAGLTLWSYRRVRSEELALSKHAVLLNEVHHRVKNNLAICQSLLMLEANRAGPEAQAGYRDSIARIEAMGLVHHLLYDHQSFEGIQAADYLHRLCEGIQRSSGGGVRIVVDAEPLEIPLDCAVPMALIANEIITNAAKHAFPQGDEGTVMVTLRRDGAAVQLRIGDNGIGVPADVVGGKATGLGMMLVRQLTRQLRGAFTLDNAGGTVFTLTFPGLPAAA